MSVYNIKLTIDKYLAGLDIQTVDVNMLKEIDSDLKLLDDAVLLHTKYKIEKMRQEIENRLHVLCEHEWVIDKACINEHTVYKCSKCKVAK